MLSHPAHRRDACSNFNPKGTSNVRAKSCASCLLTAVGSEEEVSVEEGSEGLVSVILDESVDVAADCREPKRAESEAKRPEASEVEEAGEG